MKVKINWVQLGVEIIRLILAAIAGGAAATTI